MCPIFRSGFSSASGIPVDIFTPFFQRKASATSSPSFFFITRVSAMHTGCHRRQFARKLQLKNISLWPVDHRPRWESSPEPESFSRLQPSIRACQKLKRVGNGKERGSGDGLGDLKRECDRRWQADGFGLRQRRGKRKREIFHGLCSFVAVACYFSGERSPFIFSFFLLSNIFWHRIKRVSRIFDFFYFYHVNVTCVISVTKLNFFVHKSLFSFTLSIYQSIKYILL